MVGIPNFGFLAMTLIGSMFGSLNVLEIIRVPLAHSSRIFSPTAGSISGRRYKKITLASLRFWLKKFLNLTSAFDFWNQVLIRPSM